MAQRKALRARVHHPALLHAQILAGLAKAALAVKVNGELRDLSRTLETDAAVEIVTAKSPEGLDLIRHSCAHIMAQAVQELFPGVKLAIPVAV